MNRICAGFNLLCEGMLKSDSQFTVSRQPERIFITAKQGGYEPCFQVFFSCTQEDTVGIDEVTEKEWPVILGGFTLRWMKGQRLKYVPGRTVFHFDDDGGVWQQVGC